MIKHLFFILAMPISLFHPVLAEGPDRPGLVMVMKIEGTIDPRTNRYTKLALENAENSGADIVIVEINTYGGTVNDADEIRTMILEFKKPIWVFINKNAASAGALISIACDSIYMAAGASIGAATVVIQDGSAAPDKYQSYMRSMMRSTAEANGRDPRIAEAMVDENIEIDSITESGQVITFSTSEAIKYGFCEGQVSSVEEILEKNNIQEFVIERFELSATERIIRIFLNPFISGLLILVIIVGIYFEMQSPGIGFPLAAAVIAAILYFIPYYLNGLAANWEIIVFFIGLILLGLEFFVIPGFGVAGISGMILTLSSLILVMLNNDIFDFSFVRSSDILKAVAAISGGLTAAIILIFVGGVRFSRTKVFSRIALVDTQESSKGYVSTYRRESLKGKKGTAYTVLRPAGKVMIDNVIYDAFTRGEYINKDDKIIVISDEGSTLKVKRLE
ncbi:MAG TPA: NfeD family protein [Cyclobacteriaceae bacterium]|nr:NfeD family protein [Cyclobacteriaceae bacterium]